MKTANVIILAGQSNAVGVGHVKYLAKHFTPHEVAAFTAGYPNIPINFYSHNIRSHGFMPTRLGCAERGRETFGPEIGLAEQMTARYPDKAVFIVKCAVGGTSLHADWFYPDGKCYRELLTIVGDSLRLLEADGYTPRIRAFCWMQGESDGDTAEHAAQYIRLYDAVLSNFKAAFADYMTDCQYLDGGISEIWAYYREINAVKQAYALSQPRYTYIDTIGAGLTTKNEPEEAPDIYHYDADSVIKLGRLFGERIEL